MFSLWVTFRVIALVCNASLCFPNSNVEILIPNAMVLGGEGPQAEASWMRWGPQRRDHRELALSPLPTLRTQREDCCLWTKKQFSWDIDSVNNMIFVRLPSLWNCKNIDFCCLFQIQSLVICLNGLRHIHRSQAFVCGHLLQGLLQNSRTTTTFVLM